MDNDTIEMTCEQVGDELSGYLDDVLDPRLRQAVETHLVSCERCQAILADFRNSDAMVRALPFFDPPPDMRERFFNSPRYLKLARARAHQRNYVTPLTAALVAAAMLVLALSGALLFRQGFFASQQAKGPGSTTTIGNPGGSVAPLPAGSRLIYERAGALWSAPESGTGLPQQLTPTGIQVAGWRISPNGRSVMYIDARTGALHAIRADALNDTVVGTVTSGIAPAAGFWATPAGAAIAHGIAWSPDNTRIAYLAQNGGNTALHVMNAMGVADSVAKITGSGIITNLLWSPDSIYVAYTTTQADALQSIGVYNVTTSTAQSIATQIDLHNAAMVDRLAWLPINTSATLTWSVRDGGVVTGVFRADVTKDGSTIRLTPDGTSYTAADVSASGAWLLSRGATLWEVAADQLTPRFMATLTAPVTQVHWAPSGATAAVVSGDALTLLLSGHEPVVVAHGLTAPSLVAWSPEGTVLAWQAGRMVMSAQVHQGTVSGQQTVAERDGALALIWSPDGQSLAAPSSAGLLLISADGAHVRANDSRATSNGQFSWSVAG